MGWNPFRKTSETDLTDAIDDAALRQQVYRLAVEAEEAAAVLADKTTALREELQRGA